MGKASRRKKARKGLGVVSRGKLLRSTSTIKWDISVDFESKNSFFGYAQRFSLLQPQDPICSTFELVKPPSLLLRSGYETGSWAIYRVDPSYIREPGDLEHPPMVIQGPFPSMGKAFDYGRVVLGVVSWCQSSDDFLDDDSDLPEIEDGYWDDECTKGES